jgi:hypothetical protein
MAQPLPPAKGLAKVQFVQYRLVFIGVKNGKVL